MKCPMPDEPARAGWPAGASSPTSPEPEPEADGLSPRHLLDQASEPERGTGHQLRARQKARRKPKSNANATHIVLAEAVLTVIRQRGEDLMFTDKGDYRYTDGLWHLETEKSLQAWLNSVLEEGRPRALDGER